MPAITAFAFTNQASPELAVQEILEQTNHQLSGRLPQTLLVFARDQYANLPIFLEHLNNQSPQALVAGSTVSDIFFQEQYFQILVYAIYSAHERPLWASITPQTPETETLSKQLKNPSIVPASILIISTNSSLLPSINHLKTELKPWPSCYGFSAISTAIPEQPKVFIKNQIYTSATIAIAFPQVIPFQGTTYHSTIPTHLFSDFILTNPDLITTINSQPAVNIYEQNFKFKLAELAPSDLQSLFSAFPLYFTNHHDSVIIAPISQTPSQQLKLSIPLPSGFNQVSLSFNDYLQAPDIITQAANHYTVDSSSKLLAITTYRRYSSPLQETQELSFIQKFLNINTAVPSIHVGNLYLATQEQTHFTSQGVTIIGVNSNNI